MGLERGAESALAEESDGHGEREEGADEESEMERAEGVGGETAEPGAGGAADVAADGEESEERGAALRVLGGHEAEGTGPEEADGESGEGAADE